MSSDEWLEGLIESFAPVKRTTDKTIYDLIVETNSPDVQRPHLEQIDQVFMELLSGEEDRVILTTPPQVGKSMRAGVWGQFWWMKNRPKDRIVQVSYAAQLAHRNSRRIRNLVRMFGAQYDLHLNVDRTAVDEWELLSGGGMRASGVVGGISGNPANFLVVDDPHKDRAEADSIASQEAVWDLWSSVLVPRLSPGAPVLIIQTRWSPGDLAGRVLEQEGDKAEGGRWKVLSMPAIATQDNDILDRKIGDPLTHPLIPTRDTISLMNHWNDKKKTVLSRDWMALYQCDPKPRVGHLLTDEQVAAAVLTRCPARQIAVGVDPSGGGRDEAGVIGGYTGTDGKLRWTHDWSGRMTSEGWGRAACALAHAIGATRIVFEKNYGGDMAEVIIRTSWKLLQTEGQIPTDELCPKIVGVNSKRNKILRADPVAQQVLESLAAFEPATPGELSALMDEFVTWEPTNSWSPGRLDAAVHLAHHLLKIPGSATVVSPSGSKRRQATTTLAAARRMRSRGIR